MRRNYKKLFGIFALLLTSWSILVNVMVVQADTASALSLGISQLKITSSNGQFIALYNQTNSAQDMSKYSLDYFNNYDLSKATSSKIIPLTGLVPPHGYYVVSDDTLAICYQTIINSMSLGLSSTAGFVELIYNNQNSPGSSVMPMLQDYVAWSKTAAAGAQILPSLTGVFLQRLPLNSDHNPAIVAPGAGTWQAVQYDSSNPCHLNAVGSGVQVQIGDGQLLPGVEPPSTFVSSNGTDVSTLNSLPDSDVGLMAPLITELLPNPVGTGNDAVSEYIELYNPNPVSFDLSGLKLTTGLTNNHTYVFPASTFLLPKSFRAFYSAETGLSLSNTSGQSQLLDPNDKMISSAAAYGSAADGQSWSLSGGQWYWSTKATPNAANIIEKPTKTTKASKSSSKVATKSTKSSSAKSSSKAGLGRSTGPGKFLIHGWTIVMIAVAAILYWAYEYRADIANRGRKLAGYIRSGVHNRRAFEGRRSD